MARVLEQIDVGRMKPEDAQGVADLFRAFYGEGYPVKTFYNPEMLIAENESKKTLSVVARNEVGKVVGHASLYVSGPYEKLYEHGAIVVHPEYQRKRCSLKSIALAVTAGACDLGYELKIGDGMFGESVCNHVHIQKFAYRIGGFWENAFEVDLMPAEAYDKSGAAKGRVSTILSFGRASNSPRQVFVPARYKEQLEYIYEPLELTRDFQNASCDAVPASGSKCSGKTQFFDFANTSRISLSVIGDDFADYVSSIENDSRDKGGVIFQLWLPLDSPCIDYAVEILKKNGYFFGGVLPFWNNCDSLLMQKIENETDWDAQCIYSDRGKKIVAMVREDTK
jgi:hypothetical protein